MWDQLVAQRSDKGTAGVLYGTGDARRTSMAGQILFFITRYGRSRVYHPANGCYVSSHGLAGDIDDLREWQREGVWRLWS